MSGSGNDFVFADVRDDDIAAHRWRDPLFAAAVCTPHTGVGSDGVAMIEASAGHDFRLRYFNRDGSLGELCGNASLCATRLAVELEIASPDGMSFETDAGVIHARIRDGSPEIDLQPPADVRADAQISRLMGEDAMGHANTGVPHLVIRSEDLGAINVLNRGPELRYHESLPAGANVNWVAPVDGGAWAMRTYERGVEAETLACGTGAVACAVLLRAWGKSGDRTTLRTRSGKTLVVTVREVDGVLRPSLAGEGRVVFEGVLRDL